MVWSPAVKRYNVRVLWLSVVYAAALLSAVYAFKHQLLSGPAAYLAAILPALPIIGIFAAIGRYLVEESDELRGHELLRKPFTVGALAGAVSAALARTASVPLRSSAGGAKG